MKLGHLQRCGQTQRLSYRVKSEREKYDILTLICGIQKNGIDNLICKAEIETQMQRTNVWRPSRGGGQDKLGDWDGHINTIDTMYKTGN